MVSLTQEKAGAVYIGLGTIVVIVLVVLVIMMLRRG